MKHFKLAIILVVLLTDATQGAVHHVRSGNGTGSAVSFHRDGSRLYLFTANHVLLGKTQIYVGLWYPAMVVQRDVANDTALLVVEVDANTLRSLRITPLATSPPRPGDVLLISGIANRKAHHVRATFRRIGAGKYPPYSRMETSGRSFPGQSGGAFTHNGKLVGLISGFYEHRDIRTRRVIESGSFGSRLTALRTLAVHVSTARLVDGTARKRKPVLVVFSQTDCAPCRAFERDKRHFAKEFDVRTVKRSDAEFAVYVAEYRLATGRTLSGYPTLWPRGAGRGYVGYTASRRFSILRALLGFLKGAVELIIGRPQDYQPPIPGKEPSPVPAIKSALDHALEAKADLKALKEGNLFSKIPAAIRLKKDLAKLATDKDKLLGEVATLRKELKGIPDKINAAKSGLLADIAGHKELLSSIRNDFKDVQTKTGLEKAVAAMKFVGDLKESSDVVHDDVSKVKAAVEKGKTFGEKGGLFSALMGVLGMFGGRGLRKKLGALV